MRTCAVPWQRAALSTQPLKSTYKTQRTLDTCTHHRSGFKNVGGLGGLGGWCVAWWVLWEVLACEVGVCDDGPRLSEWVGRYLAVGVDAGVGFR